MRAGTRCHRWSEAKRRSERRKAAMVKSPYPDPEVNHADD